MSNTVKRLVVKKKHRGTARIPIIIALINVAFLIVYYVAIVWGGGEMVTSVYVGIGLCVFAVILSTTIVIPKLKWKTVNCKPRPADKLR